MSEERIFFFNNSRNQKLLGFIHLPSNTKRNTFGILYIHPFAEEQNCSHSIVVKTARAICELGIPVMRFDMSGFGDSEGNLEEFTVTDWLEDINKAIEFFKNETQIEKIGLWGLRLGAGLAAISALSRNDCILNIYWQPVLNFEKYINQVIRQKLSSEITEQTYQKISTKSLIEDLKKHEYLEIMGYIISSKMFKSFIDQGDVTNLIKMDHPLYLASISLMEKPPYAISAFAEKLDIQKKQNFSHIRAEPFWDRYWQWDLMELTKDTLNWLRYVEESN